MRVFQQNESVAGKRDIFVQMVDAVDYVSAKTQLALTVEMVKAGGSSYTAFGGTSSEIGDGTYKVSLAVSDLDTEGDAMLKVTADGAAPQYVPFRVVRFLDEVHLAKAALVNHRSHTIDTGVDEIHDDDGTTVLRTMTPSENNGVVSVIPS